MKQFTPPAPGTLRGPNQSGNGDRYYYIRTKDGEWHACWRSQFKSEREWYEAVAARVAQEATP